MQQRASLMDLFKGRPIAPLTPPKLAKKSKLSSIPQDEDDPLQKILGWRDKLKDVQIPKQNTYRLRQVKSIVEDDQKEWGSNFQGILINVDWQHVTFEQFEKLKLDERLINNGIVFVWGSCSNIGELFSFFSSQGFQYVQNFMFVTLNRQKIPAENKSLKNKNNLFNYFKKVQPETPSPAKSDTKIQKDYEIGKVSKPQQIFTNQPSQFLGQSQKVLYLFRKHNKNQALQLRHQRTSDAFFTIGDSLKLDWKSMEVVYKMIQTLLIKANYKEGTPLKLLELWGEQTRPRKGWSTVCQITQI